MVFLVIDAPILAAACLKRNTAERQIVRKCLTRDYWPLVNVALFVEYEDILAQEELFNGSSLSRNEARDVLQGFLTCCRWTEVYYAWKANLPDEADNHLLELASIGGASAIVTRNLKTATIAALRFSQVKILLPEECLEVFK